jgi:diguanylate cyclase (GGDEF)-like protein/PAS domain S-box-containing protein
MSISTVGLERQGSGPVINYPQQNGYDRLLVSTALQIRQATETQKVLATTIEELRKILNAERVLLYHFDADGMGIVLEESLSGNWPIMQGKHVIDPCFVKYWKPFYEQGRIQATADIYADGLSQCHIDFLAQFQIRANLVVPVLRMATGILHTDATGVAHKSDRLWGLLAVQQCSGPREWQSSEISFVDQIASQMELAIYQSELQGIAQQHFLAQSDPDFDCGRRHGDLDNQVYHRIAELEATQQKLMQELTDHKAIERTLLAEKELAQTTLESIGDGVITTDGKGNIQYCNPVAEELMGWMLSEVKGLPLVDVFNIVNELTRRPVENPVNKVLQSGKIAGLASNTILLSRDGTEYPIEDSASPIRAHNGEIIGVVLVFHDVTQSRHLARQLSWQANHDELTGLFNRRAFERQLIDALVDARSQKQTHTLCYLDLDQFKVVNDTCGHAAGDQLLRQVTELLQERVRLTDTLSRLGGDEFGLLLRQCPLPQAVQVVEDLRTLVQNFQFTWKDQVFKVGVSIGLAAITADSENLDSIIRSADAACYAAKEKGRNCIYVYQDHDDSLVKRQSEREWITRLDRALSEDRFQLYQQKITPLTQSDGVEHSEILLRLVDETGGIILPGAFIPAAERYHLISAIDQWVITDFFSNYHLLSEQDEPDAPVSKLYNINLSGASVNDDQFLKFLQRQLIEYQIPPESICFEITETIAIANLAKASHLIHAVKEMGCSFALDDFGSGMSSLAYLKHLPIDYLKIDGGFIRDIVNDRMDYAMVECVNRLSHFMGIQTIAECVENESTLETLQTIGVDYAQGFCIAEPSLLR